MKREIAKNVRNERELNGLLFSAEVDAINSSGVCSELTIVLVLDCVLGFSLFFYSFCRVFA